MNRSSPFSYECNACGRCCRDKVITLSPYDLIRITKAAGVTPGVARDRYTIRRGSILKFDQSCTALAGTSCTIHPGRPLACRLYPLGIERSAAGIENFVRLEPAVGSLGVYGESASVDAFLAAQGVAEYLAVNARYRPLILLMRARIETLIDFETVEPREFWRRAIREALAESNYDANSLIDALFDPGRARMPPGFAFGNGVGAPDRARTTDSRRNRSRSNRRRGRDAGGQPRLLTGRSDRRTP